MPPPDRAPRLPQDDRNGPRWGSEAAAAARDHALDVLGLDRVVAIIHPRNVASQRVAEKIGLTLEKEFERHGTQKPLYVRKFEPGV